MPVHVLSMPQTDWVVKLFEILASGLITSIIILVVTVWIDYLRARKRYKSHCALLISEIHNNFHKLITNQFLYPNNKLNFEFSIWEKVNHEIVYFLNEELFITISALYLFMKNSSPLSFVDFTQADIEYLKQGY